LEKPMTQAEPNFEKSTQSNTSDLYLQLAQKLARGEISQEVYLQAISSLKNYDQTEGVYSYQ